MINQTGHRPLEYVEEGDEVELEIEFNWSMANRSQGGKFELFDGKNGEWYFRLKASNSQVVLTSQKYKTKQGAEKGVAFIKKNASENNIEYRPSQSDQPYFVLKATNSEVIGTSQMYKRRAGCEKGARSVVSSALNASVEVV